MRFTREQEAEYRAVQQEAAAREHAEAVQALSIADRSLVRAAVHACRVRRVLSAAPLPTDFGAWNAYHAGIVHAAIQHHTRNGTIDAIIEDWRAAAPVSVGLASIRGTTNRTWDQKTPDAADAIVGDSRPGPHN